MIDLVLLDRDGVINENLLESVRSVDTFRLLPGSAQAIAHLNKAHIPVAIVTNQAIVGRGEITLAILDAIHQKMHHLLAREGATIDALFYCIDVTVEPHFRRKPAPGMLKEALEAFKARASYSPMIGDALRDLQAAATLGCPRILVRTGHGEETIAQGLPSGLQPVHIFPDLLKAVKALMRDPAIFVKN